MTVKAYLKQAWKTPLLFYVLFVALHFAFFGLQAGPGFAVGSVVYWLASIAYNAVVCGYLYRENKK